MDPPNGYELVTFLLVEAGILGDINMYKYLSIDIQLIISYNIRTYISIYTCNYTVEPIAFLICDCR